VLESESERTVSFDEEAPQQAPREVSAFANPLQGEPAPEGSREELPVSRALQQYAGPCVCGGAAEGQGQVRLWSDA
jgi:hypothetical protein